jgi:hypothetical protein
VGFLSRSRDLSELPRAAADGDGEEEGIRRREGAVPVRVKG